MQELVANGPTKVQAYGAWIATRYKNQKNIVWMMGGDMGTPPFDFNPSQTSVESALLTGLKSVPGQQSTLFSAEWNSESIATDQASFGSTMTLNGAYSFSGDVNYQGRRAYTHTPAEPAFVLEEPYDEEGPDGNGANGNATQPVRRFQWWGWLSTIGGYISGNGYVWPFNAPAWQAHLDTQGSRDMARLNAFIKSFAWYQLVPSGLNGMRTLITAGNGSNEFAVDYVAAAAAPDGSLAVAYIPPDHTGAISFDMATLSGPVRARWFDPTNATYSLIATDLPNTGSRSFTPPSANAAGSADWVLVLDISSAVPDTSITSTPPNPTNSTTASFAFTGTGSGFECKLDGGVFGACTSPQNYSGLAAGNHTFQVRATDGAGNVDPSPASFTWTVDLTAPDTTLTSSPANPSNSASASFSFSASEAGSTFACQLDGAGFTACSSPKAYSSLAPGSHTFQVRATDGAGNVDPSPASFTWTIDLTAPDTTLTSSPANPSNSASASFSFTATEGGSTFECKLDGGTFGACTSPKTYTSLSAGSHTFQARAIDAAGNTDPSPASFTWTVDLTAPDTTLTSTPPAVTNSAAASFGFTATEGGSSFECKLDGGAFGTCSSPQPYSGLAAGSHTFQVRAIDGAGNVDPSPASFTWTVDLTAPDTTLTSTPANPSNSASASFSFSASEAGSTFACQLDGAGFTACSSPKAYSSLAPGSHTFQVRATDGAGNVDPSARQFHVDRGLHGPRHDPDQHAAGALEQRRRELQLHGLGRRQYLRVQAGRRDVRCLYQSAALLRPRPRQPHLPGPGHRWRQQRRPLPGQLHVDRRSHRPRYDPDQLAGQPEQQCQRQLQLLRLGSRQYLRLSARWGWVHRLFESESVLQSGPRQSHLPGPGH